MSFKSNRPFSWSLKRVELSPFSSMEQAKKSEKAYNQGKKIGFTFTSSLKSMGRIPRSHGKYELGDKYMAKKNPVRTYKLGTQIKRQRQSKAKKAADRYASFSREFNPSHSMNIKEEYFKKSIKNKTTSELQKIFNNLLKDQKNIEKKGALTDRDYETLNKLTRLRIILLNEMVENQKKMGTRPNPSSLKRFANTEMRHLNPATTTFEQRVIPRMTNKELDDALNFYKVRFRNLKKGKYNLGGLVSKSELAKRRKELAMNLEMLEVEKKRRRKSNPQKSAKSKIEECRRIWKKYCAKPGKMRLKAVEKCCDEMKDYSQKTVKEERKSCMRAIATEKRHLTKKK